MSINSRRLKMAQVSEKFHRSDELALLIPPTNLGRKLAIGGSRSPGGIQVPPLAFSRFSDRSTESIINSGRLRRPETIWIATPAFPASISTRFVQPISTVAPERRRPSG